MKVRRELACVAILWSFLLASDVALAGNLDMILDSTNGSSAVVISDANTNTKFQVDSQGTVGISSGANGEMIITNSGDTIRIGRTTTAGNGGVAIGVAANGDSMGVALGAYAVGPGTNIAIGAYASARNGQDRIAIGQGVTNDIDNSVRLRGALYLDGSSSILGRSTFGSGSFQQLSPLSGLSDVIWVATNGTAAGPGTIDRPFDLPQSGYNAAQSGGAVVIASGVYPASLMMNRSDIHVVGLGRPVLQSLAYSGTASVDRVQVRDIIVSGIVQITGGKLKCVNCRFTSNTMISSPASEIEFQDCYFVSSGMMPVLMIGPTVSQISINNCAIQGGMGSALIIGADVSNLEVLQSEFVARWPGTAAVWDQELNPLTPQHHFSHNTIIGEPAVQAAGSGNIAFFNNTVQGNLAPGTVGQYHGNNVIIGIPQWGNIDIGMVMDATNGNIRMTMPRLPDTWDD